MKHRISRAILIPVLAFSCISLPSVSSSSVTEAPPSLSQSGVAPHPSASSRNGIGFKMPPLRFEANAGQTASEVLFTARGRDTTLFLTATEAALRVSRGLSNGDTGQTLRHASYQNRKLAYESATVRLKPVNGNPRARVVGIDKLPGVTNYLIGNDPKKWRTNVAGYARVKYEEVYQGIDLVYYGNDAGRLEYDFIVRPGADPAQIAVSVEGADRVEVDPKGELIISAATGSIRQPAPRIYQEINGRRQEVAGSYRLLNSSPEIENPKSKTQSPLVAFELAEYDESRTLVIDPEVIYATYLGGSSTDASLALDRANDVAVDATGSAYIVGSSASADFPTRLPLQGAFLGSSDAFITKLDAIGQLIYSTYLGGSGGEVATAIKVNETGAVYLGGSTGSPDFPRMNALQSVIGGGSDAFVAKLNATGSALDYSTYLGGRAFEGVEDLALDAANNLFVLGSITLDAGSNDFPTVNPLQARYGGGVRDGFWSVINPNGSGLLYSTYLGGDGNDRLQSIDVDPNSGNVYLSYFTDSSNFLTRSSSVLTSSAAGAPKKGGRVIRFQEGNSGPLFEVIAELDIDIHAPSTDSEALIRVGEFNELIRSIFADADVKPPPGEISPHAGGGLDARMTVFDQNLNVANTLFFGGSREETISALAIDNRGAIYITGNTTSTDLPTVNPIQANHGGGFSRDGFLAVFHPQTFEPVFATYLGGSGRPDEITGVTVDAQGNIYVVGLTNSTDFPTATPGALQNQLRGWSDAFIIKISPVEFPTGPDFTLGFSQPTVTASRGTKVKLPITINRTGGFTGNVTVTPPDTFAQGLAFPSGPQATTGDSLKFKLKIKGNAAVGPHQLTFTGRDEAGRERTATMTVVVQ